MEATDIFAIHEVIYDYCHLTDEQRFDELGDLMGDCDLYLDGRLIVSRDGAAITRAFVVTVERNRVAGVSQVRHLTVNVIVRPDGDGAVAKSACLVTEARGNAVHVTQSASYTDRFLKLNGAWRLVERRICVDNRSAAAA